jgi:NADH:ubiquinone oxidoreductase subunit E
MKLNITICMGSSCFARGNENNLKLIEDYLASHPKMEAHVELRGSRCMENCKNGPMLLINGTQYTNLDSGSLFDILNELTHSLCES